MVLLATTITGLWYLFSRCSWTRDPTFLKAPWDLCGILTRRYWAEEPSACSYSTLLTLLMKIMLRCYSWALSSALSWPSDLATSSSRSVGFSPAFLIILSLLLNMFDTRSCFGEKVPLINKYNNNNPLFSRENCKSKIKTLSFSFSPNFSFVWYLKVYIIFYVCSSLVNIFYI